MRGIKTLWKERLKIMRNRIPATIFALTVLVPLLGVPISAGAQQYQPSVGQDGKDVIWVPTPEALVAAMLDMAKVTPGDYVVDLGSGDGRIVIAAAKRGVRALGVEYNPDMVELSRSNALKEGVSGKASFMQGDIFETDFSQATVLTLYLLPSLNMKLRPKILEMRPGTRVVCHAFTMEDWEADQTVSVEDRNAYLWIVPAKVEGSWTFQTASGNAQLTLRQTFQKIEGILKVGSKELPLKNAKLEGDRISFSVEEGQTTLRDYSGRVNGGAITGMTKVASGTGAKWVAERHADR
jgi:precorrin-6B methylase 2